MTVRELIIELGEFDPEMLVVFNDDDDTIEPWPDKVTFPYDSSYYRRTYGGDFVNIPAHTPHVRL